jgi:hypothetical protein
MNEHWKFEASTMTVRDHRNHCLFSAKTFGSGGTFDAARLPDAEKILRLAAAAPKLLAALEQAVRALNTAPRFKVGGDDSYKIASLCDEAVSAAKGGQS